MARIDPAEAGGPNVCALLDVIKWSELGAALILVSDSGYNVLVGSTAKAPKLFKSYAEHPNVLVDLPNLGIKSTAAGALQIIHPTWVPLQKKLGLNDFGPVNQERAGIELLKQCGAYPHILNGTLLNTRIATAITLAAPVWASLPNAGYGQRENKMLDLLHVYGGALAHYESLGQALGLG